MQPTYLLAVAHDVAAFGLPIFALVILLATKLMMQGRRAAESLFFAALTLVTLVTMRTVATNDPAWLTHTLTLAMMIVGAVWLPALYACGIAF